MYSPLLMRRQDARAEEHMHLGEDKNVATAQVMGGLGYANAIKDTHLILSLIILSNHDKLGRSRSH